MRPNYQKLISLSQGRFDREEDRLDFLGFFNWADDLDLKPIVQLLLERPEMWKMLQENIKAKQDAIASKDSKAWDKIFQEELAVVPMEETT